MVCDVDMRDKCIVDSCNTPSKNSIEEISLITEQEENFSCKICSEDTLRLDEFVKFKNCEHQVCRTCFKEIKEKVPKCPFCQKWFDKPIGNQPKDGKMTSKILPASLPGYTNRTIEIIYDFPDGIQQLNHPNPGIRYLF